MSIEQRLADIGPFSIWIGSTEVAESSIQIPVINPATGEVMMSVPGATPEIVDAAIRESREALGSWRALGYSGRVEAILGLLEHLSGHIDDLAFLDAIDAGNPYLSMQSDVTKALRRVRFLAGIAPEVGGKTRDWGSQFSFTAREPYGIVARIIPFNHPAAFAIEKVAAPLLAGNVVLLKPSEHTSLSAMLLGRISQAALPSGVLTVLPGFGGETGRMIIEHPEVRRIAMIAGVEAGRAVLLAAAAGIKNVSLELGGKNPLVVMADADVKVAAAAAVRGMNFNSVAGQSCGSTSRVLVHESLAEVFSELVIREIEGIKVGDPLDPATDMGPLSHEAQYLRVQTAVEEAQSEGARLLIGGARPSGLARGYFYSPTVLGAELQKAPKVMKDEIFGPVLTIAPWKTDAELLENVNNVEFGLTASIMSGDTRSALRLAQKIEAGYIWINSIALRPLGLPFGGYKHSGWSRESSLEEIESFTQLKSVVVAL